jgi:hypothetical protein
MTNTEDKIKAGAKAVANKVANAPNDFKAEYDKKKMEEDAKDAASGNLDDSERAANSVTAAAKAVVNKVKDAGRDLDTEYKKEKAKETFE